MKGREIFLFSTAVFLFIIGSSASAYYNVIDLGTLGGSGSEAQSVNDNGQIVGWAYNSSGEARACLFSLTGNTDLGTLGGNVSVAYSINNSGQIVGYALKEGSGPFPYHACLFDPTGNGANIDLGTLGGNNSSAFSINNNGWIVGWAENSSVIRACLFDPTGGGANTDVGGPYAYSGASSINDNGQIVGSVVGGIAYLFVTDITLGNYGSRALSINNNSQIVGEAMTDSGYWHAYLFDPTGRGANIDLGTLGGNYSGASSINDNGQIVGWADEPACLFDPTGGGNNIDLNTLIDPSSGWTLTNAYSINNNGWIVGSGFHNSMSYTHAYLLVPEEDMALVNMKVFARFAAQWLRADCAAPDHCECSDFDFDGDVDINDLDWLTNHWLWNIPSACN